MKFQNDIEIQASINDVFEFLADMKNMPKWNYFVTMVTQENGTALNVAHAITKHVKQTASIMT